MNGASSGSTGLPGRDESAALSEWLGGPRGRLLRRAQIGLRRRVLEVGCGHGHVTDELARRCVGDVVAIDLDPAPMTAGHGEEWARGAASCAAVPRATPPEAPEPHIHRLAADAQALPFAPGAFDLVFCQNVLMWVADLRAAIAECARVLASGGALVAIEPDYGGMLEYPDDIALRDVWIAALSRAGADPFVGRKLPVLCEAAGLDVHVELQNLPQPATPAAVDLLRGLALTDHERARAAHAKDAASPPSRPWSRFVHLPYILVTAVSGPP